MVAKQSNFNWRMFNNMFNIVEILLNYFIIQITTVQFSTVKLHLKVYKWPMSVD